MSGNNSSAIDLIMTNKPKSFQSFQNTTGVSIGISDYHKMVLTSMEITLSKYVLSMSLSSLVLSTNQLFFGLMGEGFMGEGSVHPPPPLRSFLISDFIL